MVLTYSVRDKFSGGLRVFCRTIVSPSHEKKGGVVTLLEKKERKFLISYPTKKKGRKKFKSILVKRSTKNLIPPLSLCAKPKESQSG